MLEPIPSQYRGWWRIIETSQWANDQLDILGPALISLTGLDDRLRMLALLAYVNCTPIKSGVSFTWEGAWEFDPVSGSGRVSLGKDGRLRGSSGSRMETRARSSPSGRTSLTRRSRLPQDTRTSGEGGGE